VSPSLNFAGGDFVDSSGFTDCMVHVNFAATSRPDGVAHGTLVETAVPNQGCSGSVTVQISCLLVSGTTAQFDGWADNPSGIFTSGQIVQGTVTAGEAPDGNAGLGIAGGSPGCPPAIAGTGPGIRSGTIVVRAAQP
jgi:hypothetical protein